MMLLSNEMIIEKTLEKTLENLFSSTGCVAFIMSLECISNDASF